MGAAAREALGDESKPSGFSLIRRVEDPPLEGDVSVLARGAFDRLAEA
jgi:hypothetical protein